MTDLLPLLIWMLAPVGAALRGAGRALFLFAVIVSVAIEAIGAFSYTWSIDLPVYAADPDLYTNDMKAAWQWRNAPFLTSRKNGRVPPDFAVVRGSVDAIESDGRATSTVTAGQEVTATGWALTGHTTPLQVAVAIDGRKPVGIRTFTDRPDVRDALHETNLCGWRVTISTSGLAAGVHHLSVLVWASEKGEGHFLAERELTVLAAAASGSPSNAVTPGTANVADGIADDDLRGDFAKATARLREHQQPQGYWLTQYTNAARFHDPHPEMNTFLTALLVDLLTPLPATNGLEASLQRARRHLTNQIESTGLVRYHGLPDAPGIGTLGCVITPDTDDTALVWRIAPHQNRRLLANALTTIDRYRTPEGLYRSWLAPRDAFQCLDPGNDPNPADIAIQMHLLMLLSEVRPASSQALCRAVRPLVDDDRIWVYYRKTPLIPILRLNDLRRAGCALKLPESRMRSDVEGQQIWVSVARLLTADASTPDVVLIRAILRELARDDFALIRTNPPLLYHNDLTASVARYYWSEDVGYALWLRLQKEYELHTRPNPN